MRGSVVMFLASLSSSAVAEDFSGFNVHGGFGATYSDLDLSGNSRAAGTAIYESEYSAPFIYSFQTSSEAKDTPTAFGAFATIAAGYDLPIGRKFVLGIHGNYDFGSSQEVSVSGTGIGTITGEGGDFFFSYSEPMPARMTLSAEMGNSWGLGARIGALVAPSTLLFLTVGYTQAEFSLSATAPIEKDNYDLYASSTASQSSWESGYSVGGGLETLLSSRMFARVEYRYANYSSLELSDVANFSADSGNNVIFNGEAGIGATLDPDVHSLRATIGWRLGDLGQ